MIKYINDIKQNISNKKVTVLGAGISGQGASNLAIHLGADVLLSTNNKQSISNLISDKINIEFSHSSKCLNSDLVIISPGINPDKVNIIKQIATSGIPIISEIEFGYWFSKSPIISVTGSNGKSTVVKIINDIFKHKYKKVLLGGNIGKSFCNNVINELESNTKSLIHILELSSFQLQKIITFKPILSCILNVHKDHLDRHGNFLNYFNDKMNIIKNADDNSSIVYNQDDIRLNQYCKKYKKIFPFSLKNKNTIYTKSKIVYDNNSNEPIINQKDTKLIGSHNLQNILAAVQISKIFNINNKNIKRSLIDFNPLKHRMEKIEINNNILIINDSKGTNLFSTKSAINSFKNKIILILGGFSNEQIDSNELVNIIKNENIIKIVCYGDIGEQLFKIISKHKESIFKKDFSKAVHEALGHAKKDSTVLLSPGFKSFDQFNSFEERGETFKKIVYKYYA